MSSLPQLTMELKITCLIQRTSPQYSPLQSRGYHAQGRRGIRHLSPSPSFSSDTSKPKIIYKSKASPPPPPPPDYLKHEHGNHATARRLKEELKNSSRRECRDATNDITSPRNEQADNCGEDVAEASGGATEETSNHEAGGGEANEVDKKADEFIARFREQIRLQRIESIKRSTKQRSNKKQQVV
ncbi:hypothetical protein ZIOFF_070805 [Zingiber officinale]|uniref:Uncharacterized protein n=1 Tax=Zingiber officinale TaxID=94328 RepID=A0A8J5C8U1_ZINOF|nr:hypothetical protein ZIOFF_070805 [Zingiber officinale]